MLHPPPRRARRPRVRAAAALALLGLAAAPAGAAAPLEGTWYVLVHYRDAAAADPEVWRWTEAVWHFEGRGERIEWTWYPTLLFEDPSGRFELVDRRRQARVLHAWEPNPAQREEIAAGLRVQPRGVTRKTLRPVADGLRSAGAARSASTSVIGYSETWSIGPVRGRPVFERTAAMGSARTEPLAGSTRFAAESGSLAADELSGRYERDGTREGRFRMWRAGPVRSLTEAPRRAPPEPSARLLGGRLLGPPHRAAALETLAGTSERAALRAEVRRRIELSMRDAGESPAEHARWLDRLVEEVTARLASGADDVATVEALWSEGRLLR